MSKFEKKIAESSIFNLITVYLTFIFGIINTFVIARVLAPEEWALILLTIIFINIAIFFINIFPPNAQDSIKYYIPHLTSKDNSQTNETNVIKRKFIFHIYKIRILSSIIVFFIYIIIIWITNLNFYLFRVILIMAPMIITTIIIFLNSSILLAFQKFKTVFIIRVLNPLIVMIFNSIIFLFEFKDPLYLIAFGYLCGTIISCIISVLLVIPVIPRKIKNKRLKVIHKFEFSDLHKKYGSYLILADTFVLLSGLIVNLLFLNLGDVKLITYFTICQISATSALLFSCSNPSSYISIFSEINCEKNQNEYKKLFRNLSIFLMIFNGLIIAIMELYIIMYIAIIYSEVYLIILIHIQIYLFSAFPRMIINNFLILTGSTDNTKINAEINLIEMIITIIITYVALTYFDFYILIILHVLISFLMSFLMFFLINLKINLKFNILEYYKPFLAFIVSFLIIFFISPFIFFEIFNKAYLNYILSGSIKLGIFLLFFYLIIYYTKLLTKEDFLQLIEIIPILNSKNFLVQKILKIILKFLPS